MDSKRQSPSDHTDRRRKLRRNLTVNWNIYLPLAATVLLLAGGGVMLLNRAEEQARDTTRKHHLEDIEQSLFFARSVHGTYPPYDQPMWCGRLNDPSNQATREQIEIVLRTQNSKYENPDKPFPSDPLSARHGYDYFYWKRSPAVFELYAVLEQDPNGERNTADCDNSPLLHYDYGLTSVWRENNAIPTI